MIRKCDRNSVNQDLIGCIASIQHHMMTCKSNDRQKASVTTSIAEQREVKLNTTTSLI